MPKTSVMKDYTCPDDLTQQVNAAFEEARIDLSNLWAGLEETQDTVTPPPPPPVAPAPSTPEPGAPKAPVKFVPPPPPPPPAPPQHHHVERPLGSPNSLWDNFSDQLEEGSDSISSSDPIAAFSPAPRMDWGPTKHVTDRLSFRKRGGKPSDPSAQPA